MASNKSQTTDDADWLAWCDAEAERLNREAYERMHAEDEEFDIDSSGNFEPRSITGEGDD